MKLAVAVTQPGAQTPCAPPQDSRQRVSFGTLRTRKHNMGPVASGDDAAVLQTLDLMSRIARRSACDPVVIAAAREAIADLANQPSRAAIAEAVWAYVRGRVRFVSDDAMYTDAREVLIEPPLLLSMPDPQGDCDDFTMAVVAMCVASGVPARVVTIGADPEQPGRFSHVCAEAVLEDGSQITLDASHGPFAGWSVPSPYRRLPWALIHSGDCNVREKAIPCLLCIVAAGALVALMFASGELGDMHA